MEERIAPYLLESDSIMNQTHVLLDELYEDYLVRSHDATDVARESLHKYEGITNLSLLHDALREGLTGKPMPAYRSITEVSPDEDHLDEHQIISLHVLCGVGFSSAVNTRLKKHLASIATWNMEKGIDLSVDLLPLYDTLTHFSIGKPADVRSVSFLHDMSFEDRIERMFDAYNQFHAPFEDVSVDAIYRLGYDQDVDDFQERLSSFFIPQIDDQIDSTFLSVMVLPKRNVDYFSTRSSFFPRTNIPVNSCALLASDYDGIVHLDLHDPSKGLSV